MGYALMDASPMTVMIVTAAMLVTPLYLLATFVFSGASARTGLVLASLWLVWGAVMTWVCLAGVPGSLGFAGNLIVPVCWVVPSALLVGFRGRVLAEPLSQKWLVGLQLWRAIGGVFLIELGRGNLPAAFAWPAGLGDLLAAALALTALWASRGRRVSDRWIVAVIVFGMADFVSALFFGITSGDGPVQLFEHDASSGVLVYPTGLIPLFLVPYAIFFHTLSWLSMRRVGSAG
ncbi:MAG: hypothetical protein ACTS22_07765 [Phycisphaerales bacterium]